MPERDGSCDRDLIIDVGMNDGSDTAYYLHCGYRVVAVEANPSLTAAAEQRFLCEIADGRLTILNIGIAQNEGECDFWISEANHQWSSFSKPVATRRGTATLAQPIRVRCLPLSAVVERYGVPYYLKMDIEGYDLIGLESMSKKHAPQYISVEFAHGLEMKLLDRLRTLGYTRLKLLNQSTFTGKMPIFEHEIGLRGLRKLYRQIPLLRPLIRGLVHRSDFDTRSGVENWEFPEGSSGPFGEQTCGPWMTAQDIMKKYTTVRRAYRKAEMVFWWDLHATV
jgi:FkbM family methyltransferase